MMRMYCMIFLIREKTAVWGNLLQCHEQAVTTIAHCLLVFIIQLSL